MSQKAQGSVVNNSEDSLTTVVELFQSFVHVWELCLLLPAASAWHWAGTRQANLSHLQMQRHAFHLQLAALQVCEISGASHRG